MTEMMDFDGDTNLHDAKPLKVISWNLDHLCQESLSQRAHEQCKIIKNLFPDIIFLQEVCEYSIDYLRESLDYLFTVFVSGSTDYFNAILIKKSSDIVVNASSLNVHKFANTTMDRTLMTIRLRIHDQMDILAMTSHLESMTANSAPRKEQLKYCWEEMMKFEKHGADLVFFGGDMNIRDREISELGGVPSGMQDVAGYLTKPADLLSTWDPRTNFKLQREIKTPPNAVFRFDRLYSIMNQNSKLFGQNSVKVQPISYELIGKTLVQHSNPAMNPSDHWGIYFVFTVQY